MAKVALITGVTGQDGAYLAELLLRKGYEVHGIKRRSSLFNTDRIDHLYQDPHIAKRNFVLHYGDLADSTSLINIVQKAQPDEIYNLRAACRHLLYTFQKPHGRELPQMNESQIYEKLNTVFADVFDEEDITVTPELSAKDVDGWDSLTHIRLILTIERAFKIKFSTSEIGKLEKVGDLAALIKQRA